MMEMIWHFFDAVLLEILKFQYLILPPVFISVFSLKRRNFFVLRTYIGMIVYCIASNLIYTQLYPYKLFGQIDLSYFIMILMAVVYVYFCYNVRIKNILFFFMAAYAVQNAAYNFIRIVIAVTGVEYRGRLGCWMQFSVYLFSYILFYLLIIRKMKNTDDIDWDNKIILSMSVITLTAVYVLSSFFTALLEDQEVLLIVVGRSYALLCCLLELILQLSLCYRTRQKQENEILELLLHTEQKQHLQSKENVELLNIKAHDIKHQIAALRSGMADSSLFSEIESTLSIYDSTVRTGNSALDVILTEKSLYCRQHDIRLSCIVDGTVLSFISDMDLYSLFGNILSNAIESVSKEASPERRIIDLNISKRADFVKIREENYCSETIVFEDGLPVTTKSDRQYHGFGVKSIQYLVEKYGGTLSFGQCDEMFYVNIILPLK